MRRCGRQASPLVRVRLQRALVHGHAPAVLASRLEQRSSNEVADFTSREQILRREQPVGARQLLAFPA